MRKTIESYYCDDCGQDFKEEKDLYQIRFGIHSEEYGSIAYIDQEVCKDCLSKYKEFYEQIK